MLWSERSPEKKKLYNKNRKISRHARGISIKYKEENRSRLTEEQKINNRRYSKKIDNLKRRALGRVSLKLIQLVYEDNIKKYGTLTCYLCLKQIEFGKDHLEHKIPLSRGGTNDYSNLEVSCASCNLNKRTKTPEEFLLRKGA